jgi:hypothetical protein
MRPTNNSLLNTRQQKQNKTTFIPELLGYWTLSIVQNSKNYKTHHFGNWICFCSQVMGGKHILCWVP